MITLRQKAAAICLEAGWSLPALPVLWSPRMKRCAGLFVVALALAVPLTLLTVGVAWIAHRPLIGGGILAVAAGAWVLLSRGVGKRRGGPPAGM